MTRSASATLICASTSMTRSDSTRSIIVTSNRGFEAWGEILGDQMVAAALIDRFVHHAHIVTLKGKSYRLRERGTGTAGPPVPWRHRLPTRGFAIVPGA